MLTIAYCNYWGDRNSQPDDPQTRWFSNFIKENICYHLKEVEYSDNPDILLCSCFHKNNSNAFNEVVNSKASIKIFFSGENLDRYPPYNDIQLLKDTFDLILVYNYTDKSNKILRCPFWLWYYPFYNMNDPDNNIITYIEQQHKQNQKNKTQFGTVISRHDRLGHKTTMLHELKKYGEVLCPSKFKNNCIGIGSGNKNKLKFLSKTKYNICPENSEYEGYCSEKIFESLEGGSVPIYWGINEPEQDLLWKNKYCFIKNKDDPIEVRTKIQDVVDNYDSYISGNIFLPSAEYVMKTYYETLQQELINLINKKVIVNKISSTNYRREQTILSECLNYYKQKINVPSNPAKTVPSSPAKTVPSNPAKTVPSDPAKTVTSYRPKIKMINRISSTDDRRDQAKTVPSDPAKTVPSDPAKTVTSYRPKIKMIIEETKQRRCQVTQQTH